VKKLKKNSSMATSGDGDYDESSGKSNRKRAGSASECGSGTGGGGRTGGFPPAYLSVRKAREKMNPYVELPTVEGNRRKSATCGKPLTGFDLPKDERQYSVNNFHVPSLTKIQVLA
jgi:hypothetical protein